MNATAVNGSTVNRNAEALSINSQPNEKTHAVEHGDTLSAIAKANGVSTAELIAANPQIINPDLIYPGDKVNIPLAGTDSSQAQIASASTQTPAGQSSSLSSRSQTPIASASTAQGTGASSPVNRAAATGTDAKVSAANLKVSDKGLGLIKEFEGYFAKPYNDPVGHATIGYGHLIHRGPVTAADNAKWGSLSEPQASALLAKDLEASYAPAVRNLVKVPVTQGQFDALVSFAYNVGTGKGGLEDSTLLKKLNAGDYAGAQKEFARWNKATDNNGNVVTLPGLTRRREAEANLFGNKGPTGSTPPTTGGLSSDGSLKQAASGPQVKLLQENLVKLGYLKSTDVDSSFGPKTDAALKAFQKAAGLTTDGIVGPKTKEAIESRINPKTTANATAANGGLSSDGSLKQGASGPQVKLLQEDLVKLGYLKSTDMDSSFGPKTDGALRSFQSAAGLTADGIVGPKSKAAIESLIGGISGTANANTDVVKAAQAKLVDAKVMTAADAKAEAGVYGPKTEAAIKSFQASKGIQQTGVLGPTTFSALQKVGGGATGLNGYTYPLPAQYSTLNKADKAGEGEGEFGTDRSGGRTHKGIDINAPVGTPVYATKGGRAEVLNQPGGAGLYVRLSHADGTQSLYFHLDSAKMKAGSSFNVTAGQEVGTVGRSGNTPSAGDTHLHFEVRDKNGNAVDPRPFFPQLK